MAKKKAKPLVNQYSNTLIPSAGTIPVVPMGTPVSPSQMPQHNLPTATLDYWGDQGPLAN